MIKNIRVIWHDPEGSLKLTNLTTDEELNINGQIIPKGFRSNGGTIPLLARVFVNPLGSGLPAFISHDFKCGEGTVNGEPIAPTMPRKQANKEMLRDLFDCGVNHQRSRLIYSSCELYRKVKRVK